MKQIIHWFSTKESGHGFGLHACANAMTEMDGTLSVSSEGEQQGALFTLTIPISNSPHVEKDRRNIKESKKPLSA